MVLESGWLAETPIDDSLLRRFLHNQADLGDLIADSVGGRRDRAGGVAMADCAVPVAYLNQAVLLRPVLSADDGVLDDIDDFFAAGTHAAVVLSLWPTPDLADRGWHLVGHPMFVMRPPGPHDSPPADHLELRPAATAADLATAEQVAVHGYPLPEAAALAANSMFGAALTDSALRIRIALLDGAPVAIGSDHIAHGVLNLCLAATLPAARRQGAWASLVRARLDDAPDLPAVAFTSDDSRPGFLRMGFLPITRLTLWLRP